MADENRALTLVKWVSNQAINGVRPLSSAHDLADEYLLDDGYQSNHSRVEALINGGTGKNFTSGFLTGLGGLLVLPIALPAAFAASWVIQARMAAAIARIYGHDIHSDRVRTFIMVSLVGDSIKDVVKASGIAITRGFGKSLLEKIPGRVLIDINKRVGFRLLTKAGEKGAVNLVKGIPFFGGLIGGTFDAAACRIVGHNARKLFSRPAKRKKRGPKTSASPKKVNRRARSRNARSN